MAIAVRIDVMLKRRTFKDGVDLSDHTGARKLTATALMKYEPATVSEAVLLQWIEQLIAAAVKIYSQLQNCTNHHLRLLKTRSLLQDEVRSINKDHADY